MNKKIKVILNKKYLNQKLWVISSLLSLIIATSSIFLFRENIYFYVATKAFGGKVSVRALGKNHSYTFYNLDVAEYFFTKGNENKNPKQWVNYQLSRINFIRGDLNSAVSFANRELELYPDNCRTHYIRGLAYGYIDTDTSLDLAISDFEKFNACFPNTWAGHNDLAWFWFRKGNMKKVIEVIEVVIEKNKKNPWLENTYGTALMNVGEYKKAREAFEAAKKSAYLMTEESWGVAYPGNNPKVYGKGLSAMRESVEKNLKALEILESEKKK